MCIRDSGRLVRQNYSCSQPPLCSRSASPRGTTRRIPKKSPAHFPLRECVSTGRRLGWNYYRPQTPEAFPARAGRINAFQSSRWSSPECRKIKRHPPGRIHDQGEPIEQLHGILRLEEKLEPTRTYQTARTVGRPKPDDQRTIHSALGQAQN